MKKLLLIASIAAIGLSAIAQTANIGMDQFASFNPAPGKWNMDYSAEGPKSFTFNLVDEPASQPNRNADLFATLTRNGTVIANVPVSNYKQLSYDNTAYGVWSISFFWGSSMKASLPGNYQVIFPEGFFLMGADQTPSKEIVLNYTVDAVGDPIIVEPASKSTLSSFSEVKITFADAMNVIYNSDKVIDVYNFYGDNSDETSTTADTDDDEDPEPPTFVAIHPTVNIAGNVVTLVMPLEISTPGLWLVEIPEETFTLIDAEGNETLCKANDITYNIPNYLSGIPKINPEEGEIAFFPGTIELTLAADKTINMVNTMGACNIFPVNEDGTLGSSIARYSAAKDPNASNKILLKNVKGANEEIWPVPGNYRLVTADKLFNLKDASGSSWSSQLNYNYTVISIGGSNEPTEIVPANNSNVNKLGSIAFTFGDAETVSIIDANAISWFKSETTNYIFNVVGTSAGDDKTIEFRTPVAVTMPGVYHFESGVGNIAIDGVTVIVTADYTVSPSTDVITVDNIRIMPEVFDIYSIDGLIVKRDANMEVLNSLPAGIYVAAGKKFVVK